MADSGRRPQGCSRSPTRLRSTPSISLGRFPSRRLASPLPTQSKTAVRRQPPNRFRSSGRTTATSTTASWQAFCVKAISAVVGNGLAVGIGLNRSVDWAASGLRPSRLPRHDGHACRPERPQRRGSFRGPADRRHPHLLVASRRFARPPRLATAGQPATLNETGYETAPCWWNGTMPNPCADAALALTTAAPCASPAKTAARIHSPAAM